MSRHLPDEQLWLLYEGSGTRLDRAHMEECSVCAARYRQLERDLKVIRHVLQEPPPLHTAVRPRRALQIRWMPAAAVLAATLLLAWGQEWLRVLTLPVSPIEARENAETVRFLTQELPLALFSTAELNPSKLPAYATNLAYLQAALDGGWPSEPCAPSRPTDCEPDPFFLLFEEQGH